MFSVLKLLVIGLFVSDINSFTPKSNKIFRLDSKLYDSKSTSEFEFKFAKEYYDFLKKFNIINVFGSDDNGNTKLEKYEKYCQKRIENYKIFEKNYVQILDFNDKNDFQLGINQFADTKYFDDLMDNSINKNDIYKNDFLGLYQMIKEPNTYLEKYKNVSNSLIWGKDVISDVKNQGRCGSCWAFSTTGAIEGLMRINKNKVDRLSEQELVDCSIENYGCGGGLMDLAMDYCLDNDGLTSNIDYPYKARDGKCLLNCNSTEIELEELSNIKKVKGSRFKDYKYVIPRSILDIKASLKNGPISIALDASNFAFRFYKNGVIDVPPSNSDALNHAVLLTGYGTDNNGTYWIIQNSWGDMWGDEGYCKVRAKNGDGVLLCQLYGVYPHY